MQKLRIVGGILLALLLSGAPPERAVGERGRSAERSEVRRKVDARRVVFSTDVALGLTDTHGGKSLAPIVVPSAGDFVLAENGELEGVDTNVTPQDIDDGLALAMALNLDAEGLLEVLAVAPIYGNATLPAPCERLRGLWRGRNPRGVSYPQCVDPFRLRLTALKPTVRSAPFARA